MARLAGEWTVYQKPERIALHISSPWTAARCGGRFQRYITHTAAMNESAVRTNEAPAPRSPGMIVTTTMNSAGPSARATFSAMLFMLIARAKCCFGTSSGIQRRRGASSPAGCPA